FGDQVPALKEYAFDRGVLNVTGGGKYDHGALTYDGRVLVNDLTMARTPAPDPAAPAAAPVGRIQVLQGYTLNTDAAFTRSMQPDGASLIDVSKFKVSDNTNMLSLGKAADTPLRVATPAG